MPRDQWMVRTSLLWLLTGYTIVPYAKPLELAALAGEEKIEAAARRLLGESGLLPAR